MRGPWVRCSKVLVFGLSGASGLQVECLWVRGFGGFGRLLDSGLLGVSGLGLRLGCRGLTAWGFWVRA